MSSFDAISKRKEFVKKTAEKIRDCHISLQIEKSLVRKLWKEGALIAGLSSTFFIGHALMPQTPAPEAIASFCTIPILFLPALFLPKMLSHRHIKENKKCIKEQVTKMRETRRSWAQAKAKTSTPNP